MDYRPRSQPVPSVALGGVRGGGYVTRPPTTTNEYVHVTGDIYFLTVSFGGGGREDDWSVLNMLYIRPCTYLSYRIRPMYISLNPRFHNW